jgi:hypothetical protein
MNKKKLRTLVALSVNSVILMTNQLSAAEAPNNQQMPNNANATQPPMTGAEQAFVNQLSQNSEMLFKNMTPQQRAMCIQMAAHDCKGQNACKGLGTCKTDKNACAGMNACKGQGACKTDPNKAVKIVSDKMAQKRLALI